MAFKNFLEGLRLGNKSRDEVARAQPPTYWEGKKGFDLWSDSHLRLDLDRKQLALGVDQFDQVAATTYKRVISRLDPGLLGYVLGNWEREWSKPVVEGGDTTDFCYDRNNGTIVVHPHANRFLAEQARQLDNLIVEMRNEVVAMVEGSKKTR